MITAIKETHFQFPGQKAFYRGKVRDVYLFEEMVAMVASDRISAFDVVLPRAIPYKGQILNQIATHFLDKSRDIVPNWKLDTPDPNVTMGIKCKAYPVEMVIRGYLAGHAWRVYKSGLREICGVAMPDGLKENDPLPQPIITPTTKASEGHDQDISKSEILNKGIVEAAEYEQLEKYTYALFDRGSALAQEQGLILVDTKYEFGVKDGVIYLIDEIHTPDSSRYFYTDGYQERQQAGVRQKQLSKEFVREWLMANGFQGKDHQKIPEMTDEVVNSISERYIELFENITGQAFEKRSYDNCLEDIENSVIKSLQSLDLKTY